MDTIVYEPNGSRSLVARASSPRPLPRDPAAIRGHRVLRSADDHAPSPRKGWVEGQWGSPLSHGINLSAHPGSPARFGIPRQLPGSGPAKQPGIYTKPLDSLEFRLRKVSKGSANSVKVKPFFFRLNFVSKMDTFPDSGTSASSVPEGVSPSNPARSADIPVRPGAPAPALASKHPKARE
jgi:hypothetical protein